MAKWIIVFVLAVLMTALAGTSMAQEVTADPVLTEQPVETLAPTDVPTETPLATESPTLEPTLEVTAEPTVMPTQAKATPTCEMKLNGGNFEHTPWNGGNDSISVSIRNWEGTTTYRWAYWFPTDKNAPGDTKTGEFDGSGDFSIEIPIPSLDKWGTPVQDGEGLWKYEITFNIWISYPCQDQTWDHWSHVTSIPTTTPEAPTPETPEVTETPSPTPTGETEQPPTGTPPATVTLPPGERETPTPESGTPETGENVPQGPNTGDFQIQPVGVREIVPSPTPTPVIWEQGPAESSTTFGMTPSGQVSLPHYGVNLPIIKASEETKVAEQAVGHALKVEWPNGHFTLGVHRSAWPVAGWIENETLVVDGVSYLLTNKRVMSKEEAAALEPSVDRFITCTADFQRNVVYDLIPQGK